jgi:hypothetical protein
LHGGATGAGAGEATTTTVVVGAGGGVVAAAAALTTIAPATNPAAAEPLSQSESEQLLQLPL